MTARPKRLTIEERVAINEWAWQNEKTSKLAFAWIEAAVARAAAMDDDLVLEIGWVETRSLDSSADRHLEAVGRTILKHKQLDHHPLVDRASEASEASEVPEVPEVPQKKTTMRHASGHYYRPRRGGGYWLHCPTRVRPVGYVDDSVPRIVTSLSCCPKCRQPIGKRQISGEPPQISGDTPHTQIVDDLQASE